MKKLFQTALVALVPTVGVVQDFESGSQAAQAGHYETALHEWKPLAEQGKRQAGR